MNINIPNNLKNLLPYLKHSQILEKKDPIMSYYCKYYVVQEGMKLRTNNPDEKMKKFLSSIIDQLEQQKKQLGNKLNENDNKNYVKNFALKVFQIADDEDRLGKANKNTAINFLSAAQFFDVLTQFEELTPDLLQKQKYAKWKAADINSSIKKGLTPKPGPPSRDDDQKSENLDLINFDEKSNISSNIENISSYNKENISSNLENIPSFPDFPMIQTNNNFDLPSPPNLNIQNNNNLLPSFPNFPEIENNPIKTNSEFQNSINDNEKKLSPSVSTSISSPISSNNKNNEFVPSEKDIELATKYAKFVVSSLQFEDIPSAIKNLKLSLKYLTGKDYE